MKNNIKELKQRALSGDLAALDELRKLGVLSGDKTRYIKAPVSYAQRRLWFINKMEQSPAYNLPAAVILEGNLNTEALEKALLNIINRHEILRTVFVETDGIPYQKILSEIPFKLEIDDLTKTDNRDKVIVDLINKESNRYFDLSKGPLISSSLYKTGADKYLFLFNMHHIISDGWSINVLISELTCLYNSFNKGGGNPLIPLKMQYKDYVQWHNRILQNNESAGHREYWLKKFSGELSLTEMTPDFKRPVYKTFNGNVSEINIPEVLYSEIKKLCLQNGISLYMFLLAAVNVFITRYTGKNDIIVGSPVSGRELGDLEGQIGFYVNSILLRNEIKPEEPFSSFLAQVKHNCIEAYDHQVFPFDLLIEDLNIPRDTSRNPLFEIMVSLQEDGTDNIKFDGLTTSFLKPEQVFSKFDLHFNFEESSDSLKLILLYNTDLYEYATINRYLKHLIRLIDNLVKNPGLEISKTGIITDEEKEQIIYSFNNTSSDYPRNSTIVELFEHIAEQYPDKQAVVYKGIPLSYSQLNEKANQLAVFLKTEMKLQPEEPVAVVMDRSQEIIISIIGILKAGGAYVPVEAKMPAERVNFILEDVKARIVLTDRNEISYNHPASVTLINNDFFTTHIDSGNIASGKTSSGLAYILYTSGTTGSPKGSMIEDRSVIRLVRNTNYNYFCESDRLFTTSSVSFDAFTMDLWGMLLNGGTIFIEDSEDYLNPETLKHYLHDYKINLILMPTGFFVKILEADQMNGLKIFSGLGKIFVGGDVLPVSAANYFISVYPETQLVNVYGPTENTTFTTTYDVKQQFTDAIPIGKPISNTTVYVFDQFMNLCPVGVPGELYTGGDGVSRGYFNKPELNKEKFIKNPFNEKDALYRTGDIAKWDNQGNLHFCGRNDSQVKIRGYRIEPGEIEKTAAKFPGITKTKVIVLQETQQKEIALYYTSSTAADNNELKKFIMKSLPEYMVPKYFVKLEDFPLNQNGKVDTKAFPEPERDKGNYSIDIKPSNNTERILAAIFENILNVKGISVNDNFFNLGGHSLKAIRAVSAIQKELSVKVTLKEFFTYPDIKSLEAVIRDKKREELGRIPVSGKAEYYELSHAQKRLWVLDKIEKSKSAYNIPLAVKINDEVNLAALQSAFNSLLERHEILRTIFIELDGEPFQKITEDKDNPIIMKDFSSDSSPDEAASSYIFTEAHRAFALSEYPLVKLYLIKTAEEQYILFLNIHHIICDGWSLNIIIDELLNSYRYYLNNTGSLPEKPDIQYKDYSRWLNEKLISSEDNIDRQYWLSKLAGDLTPPDLPSDFRRPPVKTYEGNSVYYSFSSELRHNLESFNTNKRSSMFMTLAAVLKVLLYKYTGKEDILIGTPVAARNHPDLENQVGYYVNTLALRDIVEPNKSFAEFLESVKRTATDSYSHQMYPFDKLIEELKPDRDTSRSPLFDVMIVFQNFDFAFGNTFRKIQEYKIPLNISKYDLTFNFSEAGDKLNLFIEYNTKIFRQERVKQIISHFEILLNTIISDPAKSINTIKILNSEEEKNLLYKFNNTDAVYPEDKTIISLFEEAAGRYPGNTAVVFKDKTLTYSELNLSSGNIAAYITQMYNVTPGEPVGVLVSPSEKTIEILLAILKTGGAYVPVDPEYPDERIKHILSESKTQIVITDDANKDRLQSIINELNSGCRIIIPGELSPDDLIPVKRNISPDSTAYIIFTSGSTGKPKGCPITHRNLVRLFINDKSHFDFNSSDVWIMAHSYCFDFSVWEMYGALLFGGKLIVPERKDVRDISGFVKLVNNHKVTILNQTPGAFYKFIDTVLAHQHYNSLGLRYVIFGGDKLNPSKLSGWIKKYPADKVSLVNMYGITETTIHVTYHKLTNEEINSSDGISNVGVPLPETRVYILDNNQTLVPVGIYGEIYVAGTGLSKGYLNRPDLTAERFIPNPYKPDEILYRSGDIGRWLFDGTIEYADRCDNQVQVRGFRVEIAEIELQLRRYPGVTDAVVIAVDREGTKELAAYIVADADIKVSPVKNFLSASLPEYMVPSYFIKTERIPLTANGKIDKKMLPPVIQNIATGEIFETPANKLEAELLEFWQEVLSTESISIRDNFFDLGGNSILLVKLHAKINGRYPGIMELTDLFTKSRISEQAEFIAAKLSDKSVQYVKSPESKTGRPAFNDIAIIGIASRIGDCSTPDEFWSDLALGIDFIGDMPSSRIPDIEELALRYNIKSDSLKLRELCYLNEVDKFDYSFFKLSPGEASLIDPGQRLFMETACHALEDAGYGGSKLWGSKTGVFIGASDNLSEYAKFIEASEINDPNLLLAAQTPSILAARLPYFLNLKGPALLVDTACSSSLVALHLACQSIREGKIDSALVGGIKLHLLPIDTGSRLEIDSSDSRGHSFDDSANGTGGGEGVIAVFIKPLKSALQNNDHIYAVIKGSEINQDGNSIGITAPDADAQAEAIEKAWIDAGIEPRTVSYIETHGTATRLGDPIEIDGITKAFRKYTPDKNFCAIGAVKANVGHLDTAAGMAGLLKAVLSLKYKKLAPLAHFNTPNRNIKFDESPVYINKGLTEWNSNGTPLRCGISSFGLSGTNCHVILEEAPAVKPVSAESNGKYLFTISSRTRAGLFSQAKNIKRALYQHPEYSPESICYTLSTGRGHYSHRMSIIFENIDELKQKLQKVLLEQSPGVSEGIYYNYIKVVASNKKILSANEIAENQVSEISSEINSYIKEYSSSPDKTIRTVEAYIKGADILWEDFYGVEKPLKVSLPGYQFEKKRCWVTLSPFEESKKTVTTGYSKEYESVFLHNCIVDTPSTAVYSNRFTASDWLLNEHRIWNIPTLVGVSYLEFAYEAGKNHLNTEHLQFNNFYLLQPLNITEESGIEIITVVNKEEDNTLRAAVSSKTGSNDWKNYAGFNVARADESTPRIININDFIKQSSGWRDVSPDKETKQEVVSVSSKWNCLKKIYWNNNESLAELVIPEEDIELAKQFYLYPPLIDAALSFAVDEEGYLPYSFGTVEIINKPSGRIFSLVHKLVNQSSGTRSYDITLTDEKGQIFAVFNGFTLKKISQVKEDSVFHELVWKQWPLASSQTHGKSNIALLYSPDCRKELINSFNAVEGITAFEIVNDNFDNIFKDIFSRKIDKIIFMLPEMQILRTGEVDSYLTKTLYSVFNLAKYLSANLQSDIDILLTASNVLEISGNEFVLNPINNAAAGLGQVLERECPQAKCRFLDTDNTASVYDIINEVNTGFEESYYYRALRKGTRYIREIKPVNIADKGQRNLQFKEDGVYIITGGTSGIGAELALFLAKLSNIKLALISRSVFPDESEWDSLLKENSDKKLCARISKLQQVKASAKELRLYSADVSSYDDMQTVINKIRTAQGHICGVIHAAGVPGNGFIFNKDSETFRNVIKSKIHGTVNLYHLLKDDKPDFFVMTSALTALIPTSGQSDYTAANSFMDAYASVINRTGINAVSINLTAWKETGMAFELGVADDGVFKSITTAKGINAVGEIMQHNLNSVILGETDLSLLNLQEGLPFYFNTRTPVKAITKEDSYLKLNKVKLSGKENADYTEHEIIVAGIWGLVLGYKELNINDNYYDLGGDSIHAIKIKSLLESRLNIKFTIADLFNHLTIAELAEYLESKSSISEDKHTGEVNSEIILPAVKKDFYPASSAQRRLFILDKLANDKLAYHLPCIWNIKGNLNISSLETAFKKVITRHDILRTSFGLVQDEPVQIISDNSDFSLPVSQLNEEEARRYIHNFIKPFDLSKAPLFRAEIIILSEGNSLLLFDAHHIIMDAYAIEIFKKELFDYYEGKEPETLKIQYKDYSEWQAGYYKTKEAADKKLYWLNQFQGEIPVINLPVDFPRISGQSSEAGIFTLCLDERLTSEIKKMSAANGISTFMILLGVYNIVLHKYTQQDDIITGVYSMGRDNRELSSLIGMFINNLPVRCFPNSELSVLDFLNNVKNTVINAYANQDYSFDELIGELNISRDLNRSPLFDVVFSYMNFELTEVKNNSLEINDYQADAVLSSEYDLMLYGIEAKDKIYITIKYKKSLFKKESIERFAGHFTKTVQSVIVDKNVKIGDIDILLPEELKQLEGYNKQYPKITKKDDVLSLVKNSSAINSGKNALLYKGIGVTYNELNKRSNRIANYLRTVFKINPGDIVGIMTERTELMPVIMLGVIKSGAAYVGIDSAYPQQRIEYILKDSKINILLTGNNIVDNQLFHVNSGIKLVNVEAEDLTIYDDNEPAAINSFNDPAYIIYTSGSTGQPKGVIITRRNLSVFLQWCLDEFKSTLHDVVYAVTSYCFDLSVFEIFYSLSAGKTIRVLKSALEISDYLEHDKNILINTVPSLLSAIQDNIRHEDFNRITAINLAGEQIPQSLIDSLDRDKIEVRNLYGPSEDTTYSTVYKFDTNSSKVLIGKPVSNTSIYIVDSSLKLVPPGHPGEICIAGDGLAKGYLYRKELSSEKFINNPFGKGRLYRTADLGRWNADGNIEYLGRIDRQVKIRGFRIEPGEIETNIRLFPGVDNAVVIADKNHSSIIAYISTKEPVNINDIKNHLSKTMPAYMVPSFFVLLESIPLTPNGKIDVDALPEPGIDNDLEPDNFGQFSLTEEILSDLWKQVLEVKHPGRHDNFFDLGGHSLKALRLITLINREFNCNCMLSDIFEAPTIARFAEMLDAKKKTVIVPLSPLNKSQYYDISHAQHRLWILNRMEKNSAAYNTPVVYHITSILDIDALQNAFKALINKHESFRTSFIEVDGEPKQVITDVTKFEMEQVDINNPVDFVNDSAELITKYISVPFDLSRAPLIKVTLLNNTAADEYILIINVHHIILDEWSIDIMTDDLSAFYGHFSGKKVITDENKFKPSHIQYKEYSKWHNAQIDNDNNAAESHKRYWLNKFSGQVPVLNLPSDFQRPKKQTFEGKTERFTLPVNLSDVLKNLSTQNNSTLFITTLALLNVLFAKYSGQNDIVIGTPIANRAHPDIENQVGFFINTLALRNEAGETDTFSSFLNNVKANTIEAFAHQMYPFDLLVDDLNLARDLSRSPLFDVMLISQTPAGNVTKPSTGLEMKAMEFDYSVSKFDLSVSFYDDNNTINYFFEYNTSLFKKERIESMFRHYCSLLEQLGADSSMPLSELNIVSKNEADEILSISTGNVIPLKHNSIVSLIEKQADINKDKIAVVYKRNKLTYSELNSKANQLAHLLIQNEGIKNGDFISIMLDRSEWSVIAMLAVLKTGTVYVPVDSSYPQSRIDYIVSNSGSKLIITTDENQSKVPDSINTLTIPQLEEKLTGMNDSNTGFIISSYENCPAYVIYTSGSTGEPKGVLGTHKCLLNLVEWQTETIEGELRTLQYAPHSFDVSVQEMLFSLGSGGTLYMIDNDTRYKMSLIADIIEKEQIELLTMPYSALNLFISELEDFNKLKSIRHIITSGEQPYISDSMEMLFKTFPDIMFHNQYGPSETHVVTSFMFSGKEGVAKDKVPTGRPINNTQIYLLDKQIKPVPVGIAGEIYIGGYNLADGYIGSPELTNKAFIKNPFGEGKLYKTGDLARWDYSNQLDFLGREDGQVKVRGYRVETGEIETCILRYPGIKETAVRVFENGDTKEITAYITCSEEVDIIKLKEYLNSALPSYMIPAFFVKPENIPHTSSGKINYRALPAPDITAAVKTSVYVQPEGEIEISIAEVWQDILNIKNISSTDDFFEIGGNSIKAIRIMSKIQKKLGRKTFLNLIFQQPTIKKMAAVITDMDEKVKGFSTDISRLNSGSGPTVFFLPPGIGYSFAYTEFARYFGNYNIFGLNFIESDTPAKTAAAIMIKQQQEGNFYLFGHSAGGNMAYDVALELTKQGRTVGGIILLDSYRQMEIVNWSPEEYKNDAVLYIEQNHAEFLDEEIKEASLKKIVAYRAYLNARTENECLNCPIIQIEANDEIRNFTHKISRSAWVELTNNFEVHPGFGGHMDMLKQPYLEKNGALAEKLLAKIISKA